MPAQAVQCPGCHATTSSYPDPHGIRICTYCGTQFKLGMSGPQIVDAHAARPKGKGPAGAIFGVVAGVILMISIGVAVALADKDNESSSSSPPSSPASTSIEIPAGIASSNPGPTAPASAQGVSVAAVAPKAKPEASFDYHHKRTSSGNNFYVLGEIKNTGEVPIDKPKLIVVLKDGSGKEVGSDFGFATRDTIYPGQTSPVSALVSDPPAHVSMDFELQIKEPFYIPEQVEGLELVEPKISRAKYGSGFTAEGKIKHGGSQDAKFVEVECHGLDADGKLLGLYTTFAEGEVLEAGGTARFRFLSLYFDEEPTTYDFFVSARPAK